MAIELFQKLISLSIGFFMIFFPGILLRKRLPFKEPLTKIIGASCMSISFWICFYYVISFFKLPYNWATIVVCVLAAGCFLVKKDFSFQLTRLSLVLILVGVSPYVYGHLISGMLPGCDIAMHGYISRLIMAQNGMPDTYHPLLHVDEFGAYSAGFHLLSAAFSAFQPEWIMQGLSVATMVSYVCCFMGLALLLSFFASANLALIGAIVAVWFNGFLQNVVGWGGTPTVLSLGLVFSSMSFLGYAMREKNSFLFFLGALTWASAALSHLIPSYTGLYLFFGLGLYWLWIYKTKGVELIKGLFICVATSAVLLLPFVSKFQQQNSEALHVKTKFWQMLMVNNVIKGDFFGDTYRLLGEISFNISEISVMLYALCILWFLFRARFKPVLFSLGLAAILFILIFNVGYWFLPLSELVYPERVMFLFVVPIGILFVEAITDLKSRLVDSKKWLIIPLISTCLLFGFDSADRRFLERIEDSNRFYDSGIINGFRWIKNNTDKNAIFHVDYDTEGIWVPALSYRASIGTHLHFIHENDSMLNSMNTKEVNHYELRIIGRKLNKEFIGVRFKCSQDPLANQRVLVFKNDRMEIFSTRNQVKKSSSDKLLQMD